MPPYLRSSAARERTNEENTMSFSADSTTTSTTSTESVRGGMKTTTIATVTTITSSVENGKPKQGKGSSVEEGQSESREIGQDETPITEREESDSNSKGNVPSTRFGRMKKGKGKGKEKKEPRMKYKQPQSKVYFTLEPSLGDCIDAICDLHRIGAVRPRKPLSAREIKARKRDFEARKEKGLLMSSDDDELF